MFKALNKQKREEYDGSKKNCKSSWGKDTSGGDDNKRKYYYLSTDHAGRSSEVVWHLPGFNAVGSN